MDDNIFDESYFTDEEYDVATETIVIDLGYLIWIIGAVIRFIRLNKVDVNPGKLKGKFLDLDKLIEAGIPEEQAVSEYKKTVKFLISRNFVKPNITIASNSIDYEDLTPNGKKFLSGYYERIGKIDTYSINKALKEENSNIVKKLNTKNIINAIVAALVQVLGGVLTGGSLGVVMVVLSVITGGLDIAATASDLKYNRNYYKKNLPDKDQENNESDGNDNAVSESISIFDPYYFN